MLQDHLKELERELSVDIKGNPNEPGTFKFVVDPELEIEFSELEEGIFLQSQIAETPKKNKEELYTTLSEANFLGMGANGSIFGLSKDLKFVMLTHLIEQDVTYQEFHDILEDYVNFAKIYQDDIKSMS